MNEVVIERCVIDGEFENTYEENEEFVNVDENTRNWLKILMKKGILPILMLKICMKIGMIDIVMMLMSLFESNV